MVTAGSDEDDTGGQERMLKVHELHQPGSCWNRALDGELVFVLLERDSCAAFAVRAWCEERIRQGRNQVDDPQIQEALRWAEAVDRTHRRPEVVASLKGLPWPPGEE